MIEQREENVTFRECMDYLTEQGVEHDIRLVVARYFGKAEVQAWNRGLREGMRERHGTDV